MAMLQTEQKKVERSTVYLTPRNKQRLAALRRGEETMLRMIREGRTEELEQLTQKI